PVPGGTGILPVSFRPAGRLPHHSLSRIVACLMTHWYERLNSHSGIGTRSQLHEQVVSLLEEVGLRPEALKRYPHENFRVVRGKGSALQDRWPFIQTRL